LFWLGIKPDTQTLAMVGVLESDGERREEQVAVTFLNATPQRRGPLSLRGLVPQLTIDSP
jgi:hypothetical protein